MLLRFSIKPVRQNMNYDLDRVFMSFMTFRSTAHALLLPPTKISFLRRFPILLVGHHFFFRRESPNFPVTHLHPSTCYMHIYILEHTLLEGRKL
jgi:hypothetical protein